MTEKLQASIRAEAISWHLRLRDGEAGDWEAFVDWLEADPARSTAYDEVVRADAALSPEAFPAVAANDDWPAQARGRRRFAIAWGLAALAAILLLIFIPFPWLGAGADRYEVATAAGEQRSVPLGDGSMVALNGGTRLILDRRNPRFAELAAGEATFTIRHDGAAPFVVVAGDHRIHDLGTAFNLVHEGDRLMVEVIEGAVRYDPHAAAISLSAGQTLAIHERGGRPLVGRRDPHAIAGWRHGRLSYRAEPLERVARDLGRSLGAPVSVDPAIERQTVTGSLRLAGGADAVVTRFAATLGMEVRRRGNGWHIAPPSPALR